VSALHGYGRRADPATHALLRSYITDPEKVRMLSVPGKPLAFLPNANYFEGTEATVPPDKLGFPAQTRKTWMSAVVNPAGRQYLERYALLLGNGDAAMLGDGGNAYTLGQPELREFLAEYRRLPAVPFQLRSDASDPVTVRELRQPDGLYFYAVNRTPRNATVTLELSGNAAVTRLSTGAAVPLQGSALKVELKPFQLVAYRAPAATHITKVAPAQR
jgi:hypothetical protein